MKDIVSVIIPCYNCEKYIRETINSVLNQTYKDIEIICVNDGSTDKSSDIIREYSNVVFIDKCENEGVVKARNLAIEKASGKYILPLDADDTIEPEYIEKAVQVMETNTDVGFVYCKANLIGDKVETWKLPEFSEDIIFENCIFNAALFKKSDFDKVNGYKEYMKNGCKDWDLWLSFIENGLRPYRINEKLFNYRKIKKNKTRTTHAIKHLQEIHYQLLKNHFSLYLENKSFIDRVFTNSNRLIKKIKKYKNLFKIFMFLCLIEFLFIIGQMFSLM